MHNRTYKPHELRELILKLADDKDANNKIKNFDQYTTLLYIKTAKELLHGFERLIKKGTQVIQLGNLGKTSTIENYNDQPYTFKTCVETVKNTYNDLLVNIEITPLP